MIIIKAIAPKVPAKKYPKTGIKHETTVRIMQVIAAVVAVLRVFRAGDVGGKDEWSGDADGKDEWLGNAGGKDAFIFTVWNARSSDTLQIFLTTQTELSLYDASHASPGKNFVDPFAEQGLHGLSFLKGD